MVGYFFREKIERKNFQIKKNICDQCRGGSRGVSNNYVGEQKSNYLRRKTKLKVIFAFLHRCSTYLKSAISYL